MPLKTLETDLLQQIKPVYLVTGPEPFQLEMALQRILCVAAPEAMRGLNSDIFRVGRDDISDLVRIANSLPMLAKSRVIVLHDIHKLKKDEQDRILDYLESPAPFTTLIMLGEKVDKRGKMLKLIKQHGLMINFDKLYESRMRPWVLAIARDQKLELDAEAVDFLVRHVGACLAGVAKELEKAALHAGSSRVRIENLSAVLSTAKEQPIFQLMDALARKDSAESLFVLKQMIDQGESPIGILAFVAKQLRMMILAREIMKQKINEGEAAAALGASPYQAKIIMEQARRFTSESLRDGLLSLSRTDLELKDGRSNDRAILEKLALSLCRR